MIRQRAEEALKAEAATPVHCPCCRGGRDIPCEDRQCSDSTWDHECTAGYEGCPGTRADVPDFAAAVLRLTGPEMREQILCVRAIGEDQADAIMALLLAAAEGTP